MRGEDPLQQTTNPSPGSDQDKPVFDRGEVTKMAADTPQLWEFETPPPMPPVRKKIKVQYKTREQYNAQEMRTRAEHERMNSRYYSRRQPIGSSGHKAVQSIRGFANANNLSVVGGFSPLEPDLAPDPVAIPQAPVAPPEAVLGYCRECHGAIHYGLRADAKFCCEAHSKAWRRRNAKYEEANKAFADYQQSAQAKAAAARALNVYSLAAGEMRDSAARCGNDAIFIPTTGGIVAIHDALMPDVRLRVCSLLETGGDFLRPTSVTVEVKAESRNLTTDHPDVIDLLNTVDAKVDGERSATIFTFELPPYLPEHAGKMSIELRFKGDPGTGYDDEYDPPEPTPAEKAARHASMLERLRSVTDVQMRHTSSHWLPGTGASAKRHNDERMRNLVARPDRETVIAELLEAKSYDLLRDFHRACRNDPVRAIAKNSKSNQ
jgi:hypothetical protein